MSKKPLVIALLVAAILITALMSKGPHPAPVRRASSDLNKLLATVDLPIHFNQVRWEEFPFPEDDSSMMPFTFQQQILVAEIPDADEAWFASNDEIDSHFFADNAARSWLSKESTDIIRNKILRNCHRMLSSDRSGREVYGVVCRAGKKALVYLILYEAY